MARTPQAAPTGRRRLARVSVWLTVLLGAWLPIVGDPLTFAAGVMREPLWRFLVIVTAAKGGRYAVLAWAVLRVQASV